MRVVSLLIILLLFYYLEAIKLQHHKIFSDSEYTKILNTNQQIELIPHGEPSVFHLSTNTIIRPLIPNEQIVSLEKGECVITASFKLFCWDSELEVWERFDKGPFENNVQFLHSGSLNWIVTSNGSIIYKTISGNYAVVQTPEGEKIEKMNPKLYSSTYFFVSNAKKLYKLENETICVSCNWVSTSSVLDVDNDKVILEDGTLCYIGETKCLPVPGFRKYKFSYFINGGAILQDGSVLMFDDAPLLFTPKVFAYESIIDSLIEFDLNFKMFIFWTTNSGSFYVFGSNSKGSLSDNTLIDKSYPINLMVYRSTIFHLRLWNICLSAIAFISILLLSIGVVIWNRMINHKDGFKILPSLLTLVIPLPFWFLSDLLGKIFLNHSLSYGMIIDQMFRGNFSAYIIAFAIHVMSFIIIFGVGIVACLIQEVIKPRKEAVDKLEKFHYISSSIAIAVLAVSFIIYYFVRVMVYWYPSNQLYLYYPLFSFGLSSVVYVGYCIAIALWILPLLLVQKFGTKGITILEMIHSKHYHIKMVNN